MPNGRNMLSRVEFENELKQMSDRRLSEFTALQLYDHCSAEATADEERKKAAMKTSSITGSITGTVTSIIVAIVNSFVNK